MAPLKDTEVVSTYKEASKNKLAETFPRWETSPRMTLSFVSSHPFFRRIPNIQIIFGLGKQTVNHGAR